MSTSRRDALLVSIAAGVGALAAYALFRPRAARLAAHTAPAVGLPATKTAEEESAAAALKARIREHYDGCSPH
jgi:hypothetical protein